MARQRKGRPAPGPTPGRASTAGRPGRRRRPVWWLALALAAVGLAAGLAIWRLAVPAAPPNLLLITLDTTRADALGCYGAAGGATPRLDRLAAAGVRFARCSAAVPLTLPSHATLLTGLRPARHGVRHNAPDRLPAEPLTLAEALRAAGFSTQAVVASFVLHRMFGLDQGFESYLLPEVPAGSNPNLAETPADEVCDIAIEQLRKLAGRRFFLWVHFYDPHSPYRSRRGHAPDSRAAYFEEVSFMDLQVGRLLDELDRLDLRGSTLIAAVGDHGEGLGEHQEDEHGYFLYESTLRVPLLLAGPGRLPRGREVAALVRTEDLFPTLLDYLAVPLPGPVDGSSLRPLIEGRDSDEPRAADAESLTGEEALGLARLFSLQSEGWKYILSPRPELYRLADDPGETQDLAAAEPARAAEMRDQLERLLAAGSGGQEPAGERAAMTDEERDRVAALGYAGGTAAASRPAGAAAGAPPAPNPVDHAASIKLYLATSRTAVFGEADDVEGALLQVLDDLPDAPAPRAQLDRWLRKSGRDGEMIPICERILADHPEAADLRAFYADRLLRDGRRDQAIAELEKVTAGRPERTENQIQLADLLATAGRHAEARQRYEIALRSQPAAAPVLLRLGRLCAKLGDPAAARGYLEQARALAPDSGEIQAALAELE